MSLFFLGIPHAAGISVFAQVSDISSPESKEAAKLGDNRAGIEVPLTDEERRWLDRHPVMHLGVDPGFAPFEFLDQEGQYRGMAADYLRLIGQGIGLDFRIAPGLTWSEAVEKAEKRELDGLPCVGITEERKRYFDYTQPYLSFPRVVFSRETGPQPSTLKDLEGLVIGVQDLSSHHGWLKDNTSFQPILYPTAQEAFLALANGDVDVVVGNLAASSYLISEQGLRNLKVAFPIPGGPQDLAFAVRKDWPELVTILNKALASIPNQESEAIRRRWVRLGRAQDLVSNGLASVLTPEEKEWLVAHPRISVAVMNSWPPLDFAGPDGKPTGIGVDILRQLGKRAGLDVRIETGAFKNNLEAVKSRSVDALLDVTPKPERAEYLNFTQPYFKVPHVIVARSDGPFFINEDDLKGKTLALEEGFGNVQFFKKNFPSVNIVEYPDTAACLTAVSLGKADAYAGNSAVAAYTIAQKLLTNLQIQGNLRKEGSILTIGVRKDWPELASILDKALAGLTPTERQEILWRWVGMDRSRELNDEVRLDLSPEEKQFVADHKPLVFSEVNWKPLSIVDNPLKYDGMIADYLKIISDRSGLKFTFEKSSTWSQVLKKYVDGKVDVVPAVGRLDKLDREILLSYSFANFPLVIVTRDRVNYIQETSQLNGHKVAVGRGYTSYQFLKNNYPEVELIPTEDVAQGLMMVARGEVFAFVGHLAVAIDTMQELGLKNLKIAGETEYVFDHRIGVDPKYPEVVSIINKVLASMTEQEHRAIYQKWLKVAYEKGVDYSLIVKVVIGAFIFLALVLYWNRRLAGEIAERKRAELRLLESEGKIRAMSEAMHDGLVMIDVQARVMYWNHAAEELFGISAAEARGKDMHGLFVPEEYRKAAQDGLKAFGATGKGPVVGQVQELTALRADGTRFPVEVGVSAFQVGEDWYAVGTIRDISERKKAEAQLKFTQHSIDYAADTVCWVDPSSGRLVYVNHTACGQLGYAREELLAMTIHEVDVDFPPDRLPWLKDQLQSQESVRFEGRHRAKDGSFFDVEVSVNLVEYEDRRLWVANAKDITERKAARRELIEKEQFLRAVIDNSGALIYAKDLEGRYVMVNKDWSRLLGLGSIDPLGMDDLGLLGEETGRALWENDLKVLEAMKPLASEERIVVNHEQVVFYSVKFPLFDADGKPYALCGISTDITEKKRAEEELQQNLEELERFNRLVVGREEKMIQLKEEINTLLGELGRTKKYRIVE